MKKPLTRLIFLPVILLSLLTTGCFHDESDSNKGNSDGHPWPSSLDGCYIEVNLETADGHSVAAKLTIKYSFSVVDGKSTVSGVNPESGATYHPTSYEYSTSGSTGYINLYYTEDNSTYEKYQLLSITSTGGEYTSNSFNGAVSGSSTGNYTYDCF